MPYQKDTKDNEKYTVDATTKDEIIQDDRYAKDKDGIPYYPKKVNGDEYLVEVAGLIERDGEFVYPLKKADGKPNYRTVPVGTKTKEVYEKVGNEEIIGGGSDGDQVYAIDENGAGYYPAGHKTFAKKKDGSLFYALAANVTVFPKDANNNEFYITLIDRSRPHTSPTSYAKLADTSQIYPKEKTYDGLECEKIIGGIYAEAGGAKFYPKDGNNNEYYLSTGAVTVKILTRYAITNDGKVILPGDQSATYQKIAAKQPPITDDDVLGLLYRERNILSTDFVTSLEAVDKPATLPPPMRYSYKDKTTHVTKTIIPPNAPPAKTVKQIAIASGVCSNESISFYKTWSFLILVIVSLMIKLFAIWWFFLRNKNVYGRIP